MREQALSLRSSCDDEDGDDDDDEDEDEDEDDDADADTDPKAKDADNANWWILKIVEECERCRSECMTDHGFCVRPNRDISGTAFRLANVVVIFLVDDGDYDGDDDRDYELTVKWKSSSLRKLR
ncbi:hypothetical protein M0804_015496 [Polistes exclamans]|nr:hypothetical protein M0804_015498 [Polistes exclamans]KAI4473074.1 hypothetical protein M0804_015496 [Polistes exclamans]